MPELPDVEVFRRYLNATALHQKIQTVQVIHNRVLKGITRQRLQNRLKGRELEKTVRHGKHLFVKLSKNGWLRMHFGMTGFLRYFKNRSQQTDHVRLRLDFSNGYCLAYDNLRLLGQIGWVSEPDKFVKDENLGPDALKGLDLKKFRKLLSGRRGSIKSALMDQNAIAGIGNIYSDEILFQAKIHPRTSAKNLLKNRLKKVYEALQQVLQVAIECRADPEKFPDHFLIPRREEGKACPRCAGRVEKITISGRSGYLCPDCQKSPDS